MGAQDKKFKVGDRVRVVSDGLSTSGAAGMLGTVKSISSRDWGYPFQILMDEGGTYKSSAVKKDYRWSWFEADALEPFAPLTIESGKFYKTRDGRKVGPMKVHDGIAEARGDFGWVCVYTDTLRANLSGEHRDDIIAEWVDEPAVAVAASNDNAASAIDKGTLVKTKNGYGFELARIGDYAWVDVGQKAPITVLISNIQAA